MIVSRAPVRFSLGGGGTDLPSYAREHGGFVVAAAVNKYTFVCVAKRFQDTIRLAYSETEIVASVDQIKHRIFKAALQVTGLTSGLELHSLADVPGNTGLGSSSSFTVALLNGLHAYKREFLPAAQLAHEAAHIEIDLLKEPIGKQDHYISTFGGVSAMTFHRDGTVDVERLPLRDEVIDDLESNLMIYYSGVERAASTVLAEQAKTITSNKDAAVDRMHRIKALGHDTRRILLSGDIDCYGEMLHEHWMTKRKLASNMSDPTIDEHYEVARKAGAIGGKLMGAGGGGFFMFYVRPHERRRVHDALNARGLKRMRFHFDGSGAQITANLSGSHRT
jgi:D-glycero-alpha-D-manno-heptose-7-phosphate kinase